MYRKGFFASRLAALRERAALTRYRLAELAGVSASYLGRLEAGLQEPTFGVVINVAQALGVPLAAFDPTSKGDYYP